ncbi:AI-2E family transporter [Actibacterium sp. D379-3]
MALPVREQAKYWTVAAAAFLGALWLLGDVILPFALGMGIAYCLDPLADWLERRHFSRVWATVTITGMALVLFVMVALLVLPALVEQALALVDVAPKLAQNLQTFLTERFPSLMNEGSTLRRSLVGLGDMIQSKGGELLNGLITSALSVINLAVLLVLVPVITFYLLMDWDNMVAEINRLLPLDHAPIIRKLAREVDNTLARFIRGQGTVCLIMGTFYAIALMLVGLQFGLIVGFLSGLLAFIPYISSILGGVVAIGLAVFQFWGDWVMIGLVAVIYIGGQIVEGNIITPKLVGDSVGLHPVWLIFALAAFGTLFGFVGMLIAVPVAASLGVLTRYAVAQYLDSRLFKGLTGTGRDSDN